MKTLHLVLQLFIQSYSRSSSLTAVHPLNQIVAESSMLDSERHSEPNTDKKFSSLLSESGGKVEM